MAYSDKVLKHFNNPENVGELDGNKKNVGMSIVGAPSCGDVLQFSIEVEDGVIKDAKFKTFGCGSAIASSSYLTSQVKGKTIEEARAIKNQDIAQALELPPIKFHCSVLAEDAIKIAIDDYEEKNRYLKKDK